jgi:hypothetical protein
MEHLIRMKDHGFRGRLLQRHRAVALEQARKRTIVGVYLSRELEQEGSKRTIVGVYVSGELEQKDQDWSLSI